MGTRVVYKGVVRGFVGLKSFATACAGSTAQEAVVRGNFGTLHKLGWGTVQALVVAFAPCKQLVQNLPEAEGVVEDEIKHAVGRQ